GEDDEHDGGVDGPDRLDIVLVARLRVRECALVRALHLGCGLARLRPGVLAVRGLCAAAVRRGSRAVVVVGASVDHEDREDEGRGGEDDGHGDPPAADAGAGSVSGQRRTPGDVRGGWVGTRAAVSTMAHSRLACIVERACGPCEVADRLASGRMHPDREGTMCGGSTGAPYSWGCASGPPARPWWPPLWRCSPSASQGSACCGGWRDASAAPRRRGRGRRGGG